MLVILRPYQDRAITCFTKKYFRLLHTNKVGYAKPGLMEDYITYNREARVRISDVKNLGKPTNRIARIASKIESLALALKLIKKNQTGTLKRSSRKISNFNA